MPLPHRLLATLATLAVAAHFGVFLAWICTTMWGLDAADPRLAIAAMQAMNDAVINAVFAPIFFGPPLLLLLTGLVFWRASAHKSAKLFGGATVLVFFGSVVLTRLANVPMNDALGALDVPQDIEAARVIWLEYSSDWQFWNVSRTIASGGATLLALLALQLLPQR